MFAFTKRNGHRTTGTRSAHTTTDRPNPTSFASEWAACTCTQQLSPLRPVCSSCVKFARIFSEVTARRALGYQDLLGHECLMPEAAR